MRNPYATNMPMSKAGTYDPSVKSNELGAGLGGGSFFGIGGGAGELLQGFLNPYGGSLDEDGVKGGALFSIANDRFFTPRYIEQVGLRGNRLRFTHSRERRNPQHIYLHFPAYDNSVYEVVSPPDGQPILKTSEEGILVMRRLLREFGVSISGDRDMTRGSGLAGGKLEKGGVDFDKIKKGKLKFMLGRPDSYKFKKEELEKINVDEGQMFEYNGKKRKMTPLLKKRIQFAINFMK